MAKVRKGDLDDAVTRLRAPSVLPVLELDDDAVRTEQVREQVSTLVTENPDAAAALVKRWLNRS